MLDSPDSSNSKEMTAFSKEIKITDDEEEKLGISSEYRDNWSAVLAQIYDARRMNCLPSVGDPQHGQSLVLRRPTVG